MSELKSALWSMWAKCRDYALRSILAKCCDLRSCQGKIFSCQALSTILNPSSEFQLLPLKCIIILCFCEHLKLIKFYIWIIAGVNKKPFACPFQDRQFQNPVDSFRNFTCDRQFWTEQMRKIWAEVLPHFKNTIWDGGSTASIKGFLNSQLL